MRRGFDADYSLWTEVCFAWNCLPKREVVDFVEGLSKAVPGMLVQGGSKPRA